MAFECRDPIARYSFREPGSVILILKHSRAPVPAHPHQVSIETHEIRCNQEKRCNHGLN